MLGGGGDVQHPQIPPPQLDSAPVGVFLSHGGVGGLLSRDLFHATAWRGGVWGAQNQPLLPFQEDSGGKGGGFPAPHFLR